MTARTISDGLADPGQESSGATLLRSLASAGTAVHSVEYGPFSQVVTLVAAEVTVDEQRLMDLAGQAQVPHPETLRLKEEAPGEEATRDNDPGQMKAGLGVISNVYCTTNLSVTKNNTLYILTAGHCIEDNNGTSPPWKTTNVSPNRSEQPSYGTNAQQIGVNDQEEVYPNSWADAGLIRVTAPGGITSEWVHAIGVSGGVPYQSNEVMSSIFYGTEPGSQLLCREGITGRSENSYVPITTCGYFTMLTDTAVNGSLLRYQRVASITNCHGDSGGLVRNGTTAYGITSKLANSYTDPGAQPKTCGTTMTYSSMQWALSQLGVTPILASAYTAPTSYALLQVAHSGLCADISGGYMANGTRFVQWTCHGLENQQLSLVPEPGSDSVYHIVRHGTPSKCLDVDYYGNRDGGAAQQWDCIGYPNQRWSLIRDPNDASLFEIHSEWNTGCLDVTGVSYSTGALLQTWQCLGWSQTNQLWRIA